MGGFLICCTVSFRCWRRPLSASGLFETYSRLPLEFERGEGSWLYTLDGARYLDFAGGVAVNSLGHCHPHLVAALQEQAAKLWHVSNLYDIPGQRTLADRLCANTFAERVFFTNSGAEALECSIKTARRSQFTNGRPERIDILTFEGAFHGRTIATIAAGGQPKYLEGFGPKAPGFIQLPFGDEDAVLEAVGPTTAAILIEPVQGEGGIRPVPAGFLKFLRKVCDDNGLLLVLDEVQCGVGRTGKFFAYEWAGIEPDIMAVAKGIGGGFPVGACLATQAASAGMVPGTHGTTYGGNPLAMAVANAVLDVVLAEGFLDEVTRKSLLLKQGLASVVDEYPDVFETVRGTGLMLGLKCAMSNATVNAALRAEHLLAVPAGDNVLRFLPPLNATDEDIRTAVERTRSAARALSGSVGKA